MEFGDWQQFLDKTLDRVLTDRQLDAFSRLRNDTDRVDYCRKQGYLLKENWIEKYFEKVTQVTYQLKCSETSIALRQKGNKSFQRKANRAALELYNESIRHAPRPGDTDETNVFAMSVANRSAVLYHLHNYQLCLRDIDLALQNGYPENLQYKLEQRKANCCVHLQRYKSARSAFEKALRLVECSSELNHIKKDKLLTEIREQISQISNEKNVVSDLSVLQDEIPDLTVDHGVSATLVNCSAAVNIEESPEKGRFLVANQKIEPGDVLIKENPFAAVLLPSHDNTHCHHCYAAFIAPIPCRQCVSVLYCTESCRSQSWKRYHWLECRYLALLRSVGVAHLSLRIVMVAGLRYLQGNKQNLASQNGGCVHGMNPETGVYSCNYTSVYHLMPHTDNMRPEDLLQYALTADLLLRCLLHGGFFNQLHADADARLEEDLSKVSLWDGNDQDCSSNGDSSACFNDSTSNAKQTTTSHHNAESLDNNEVTHNANCRVTSETATDSNDSLYIGGLILRHIQQLICNAHAITQLRAEQVTADVDAQNQVRIATAIYPTASLMNHSCDPTIISSFQNDTLIVRSVKSVPPGGEIFNCYGPHWKRMHREERQDILSSQYFFHCECHACGDDQEHQGKYQAFKCMDCEAWIKGNQCISCGKRVDVLLFTHKMALSKSHLIQGLSLLEQSNAKGALAELKKCLRIQNQILYRHNRDLAQVQDHVARCYTMLGNYQNAAKYLLKSVTSIEEIYGSESIELANELLKYSQILFNGQQIPDVLDVIQRAVHIFQVHYGRDCPQVKELNEMKDCVQDYIISKKHQSSINL